MVYIGIDVSKDHLDVAERPKGDVSRVANDDGDINKLVSELNALKPQLIVMEATGGYEMPLAGALAAGGLPVSVVNPRQVRDFARGISYPPEARKLVEGLLGIQSINPLVS